VDQVGQLNATLGRLHFQSVAKPLGVDGVLLALVPTADLDAASQQRTLVVVGGVAALVVVLLFAVLFLARNIARPLESMVAATAKMVHGDFAQRVTPSAIVELHDLAGAVNYLAEQVQLQLAKLTHQAFHDTLSNLPNRAFCLERLERALANATPESLAVLFVDLDNFKFANDSLGHEAGDGLLVAVAERLQKCMRPGDTLARLGGDEFTILLECINSVADAVGVADRIAAALRAPFGGGGQDVFITASMGVALNGPLNAFALLGTVATLIIVVIYILTNLSNIVFYLREHRDELNPLLNLVVPVLGILIFIPVLLAAFGIDFGGLGISGLTYPANLAPWAVIAWLVLGVLLFIVSAVTFAIFFMIVLPVSWLLMPRPPRWKIFMLAASYFFYGYWNWRFIGLLAISTVGNQLFGLDAAGAVASPPPSSSASSIWFAPASPSGSSLSSV